MLEGSVICPLSEQMSLSVQVEADCPMSTGIPQSQDDLNEHLREHLQFLEASSNAYDDGVDSEAKRLASSLRLLLHDTQKSLSLLGQLGMKGIDFCDSALPLNSANVLSYMGLIKLCQTSEGFQYSPLLDDEPDSNPPRVHFGTWWNGVVFVDHNKTSISRKQLVLSVADQDGGVHVDPVLNDVYAQLSRLNSLGWIATQGNRSLPLKNPQLAAVRQIAHEVLKTLKPGYSKVAWMGPTFGNIIFTQDSIVVPANWKQTPRNAPCPCGSGKKYKRCHGKPGAS